MRINKKQKTNWQIKKLGEVLKLEYGKPLDKKDRNENGKYPVYGANGEKVRTNKFYYDKPTIIVGRKGSAGELNLTEEKFWPLDVTYFVTFDDKKYNLEFLYNLLITLDLPKLAKGVKPGINRNDVYSIEIKIPTLPEQKRIVKILNGTFEKIEKAKGNAEKNLQNSKELFESYLRDIFIKKSKDWKEKRLGNVCNVIAGQSPEGKFYNKISNGLPFYQGKKEFTDKFVGDPRVWTSKTTKTAEKDDILMSVRAPVGPVNFSTQRICIGRGLASIRAGKDLDKDFLFSFLQMFESEIIGNNGAVFNSINKSQIESIPIPLPPLPEQKQIVAKLNELSAHTKMMENHYTKVLADLEELKKSLLKKAFNGEL